MTNLPVLRAFLCQLLELDRSDRHFPLAMIVNLHRKQLRAPLAAAAKLTPEGWFGHESEGAAHVMFALQEAYPSLVDGAVYEASPTLKAIYAQRTQQAAGTVDLDVMQQLAGKNSIVAELLWRSYDDWSIQEPLALLHRMTWSLESIQPLAEVLDILLSLDGATQQMTLDLVQGRVPRPVFA